MKLREFLDQLNNLVKETPEALEYDVIYASDDEGNSYHNIYCTGALVQVGDLEEHHLEIVGFGGEKGVDNLNAVIIN